MIMETENPAKNPLGSAPLPGLIAKFAIPSIIGMLVNAAYNITDQIFIGRLVGINGNAATTIVFPIMQITLALSQLSAIGSAANFNLNLGAGDEEEAKKYVGTGIALTASLAALLFIVIFLFKSPILYLFGARGEVYQLAMLYLGITVIGVPLQVFINFAGVLIRADRSPSYSMLCLVSGAACNIVLDALFMIVFHWGIIGAAAATVLGQVLSCFLGIRYFFHFRTFPIQQDSIRLRPSYIVNIARLGIANFLNHIIMATVNIVMNNTLAYYGELSIYGRDIPVAVSGIVAKVNSIMIAIVVGIAQGCQPIWSFNMGARNYDRVKETFKKAIAAGFVFSISGFLMFQLFPRQIAGIFGSGNELYFVFASQYLKIFMFFVFFLGIQPITINYFTSIGDMHRGVFLSVSRQGLLLLPLILILPRLFGINGVLYAGPIADLSAAILSFTFVWLNFRQLTQLEEQKSSSGTG